MTETAPIYVRKTTKNRMKDKANAQGKKLYSLCDEILTRWLGKPKKNGGRK